MGQLEKPSLWPHLARAAGGMVPLVGPVITEGTAFAQAYDRWRISQVEETLLDSVPNLDAAVDALVADERRLNMLTLAVDGARRTAWEAKRRLMGRVVAHALADDADIDQDAALLTALAALEPPHFRLLASIQAGRLSELASKDQLPQPYRAALIANGTVSVTNVWEPVGGAVDGLTTFGHRLLGWVLEEDPTVGEQA